MAKLYSAQLFVGHNIGSETLTVPDGILWVIRTITMFWPAPIVAAYGQLIRPELEATLIWSSPAPDLNGANAVWEDLRIVLNPGDQLEISGEGGLDIGLFGYTLSLP